VNLAKYFIINFVGNCKVTGWVRDYKINANLSEIGISQSKKDIHASD
jgi:hypothetical protein